MQYLNMSDLLDICLLPTPQKNLEIFRLNDTSNNDHLTADSQQLSVPFTCILAPSSQQ